MFVFVGGGRGQLNYITESDVIMTSTLEPFRIQFENSTLLLLLRKKILTRVCKSLDCENFWLQL